MKETHVEISNTCRITKIDSGGGWEPNITLEYKDHYKDYWYSANETSIDIDKEKAAEIIKFLQESFDL